MAGPDDVTAGARDAAAAFAAGALSVATAHQAALWALHRAGWAPWPAYSFAATRPLGVPAVVSAAFWGGVWWAALDPLVRRAPTRGAARARAALLGAALPNAIGAALVALGHGARPAPARRAAALASAVAVNALWAVTAAALARRIGGGARRGSSGA